MHFLTSLFARPMIPASDTATAQVLIDEEAVQDRLQAPNGPFPNDIQQRVFSYIPIQFETYVKALSGVSIQFYWNSRSLRDHGRMYYRSRTLRTAPIRQACMRLERIVIELNESGRGWSGQHKSAILANAIRNALGPHRACDYGTCAQEMEAAYFVALNARHTSVESDSGQVVFELIRALPLVARTRQDVARYELLSAVNAISPHDNAGWHWRCRIHLLGTESDPPAIARAFDDITSGIGKLASAAQAGLLVDLIRYVTKLDPPLRAGNLTALNIYVDLRKNVDRLDVCDQPTVLAELTGMLANPLLAADAPALFKEMYRDAMALADPGDKALVLRALIGKLDACPRGTGRRDALCSIVDDALLLGDAYAATVLCGIDPALRISSFADHIERYVSLFLDNRISRLASPYRQEVRRKLADFLEQFRRHDGALLG